MELLEIAKKRHSVRKYTGKEIEQEKLRYFLTLANTGDKVLDVAYENVGNALDRAIDIVRRGGVSHGSK